MQLRRLELTNIRSYQSAHVEFGPGTTLIVGDVGAGKTSLLYSVEMALFGSAEVDAAYLVRHGAGHAEVAVRFEDSEHTYDIARRLRRVRRRGRELFEPEKITFREDGVATTYSATEVRQRVIELLGFPDNTNPQAHSDLWRWAIYVPQERMRDILSAKAQDRLETVRKALGVERYRTAAENAQLLAADLRAGSRHAHDAADRLTHWDAEFADATGEADRLRLDRGVLERAIATRTTEVAAAAEAVRTLSERIKELDADRREVESLAHEDSADERAIAERMRLRQERGEELARRTAESIAAVAASRELPAARAALAQAEAELADARRDLEQHARAIQELAVARTQLAGAERRAQDISDQHDRARRERAEAAAELEKTLEEGPTREPPAPTPLDLPEIERRLVDAREAERATLTATTSARAELSQIDELLGAGTCPTCHQAVRAADFAPHRSEAAERFARSEGAHRLSEETIRTLEETRKARERYERARERWLALDARRTAAREVLARREEDVRITEAARTEATALVERARAEVARLGPTEEEGVRHRANVDRREELAVRRRAAVERATIEEERARSASAAVDSLGTEIARLEQEIGAVQGRRRDRSQRIASLRERLAGRDGAGAELAAGEVSLRKLEATLADDRGALVRADTRLDGEVRRARLAEKGRSERAALLAKAIDYDRRSEWVSGVFRLHVLAMERDVLAHAQSSFDREFSRYFAALVDDPGLVARTNPDFTPEVTIEGDPTPAEALSGGERTSLALAFRLALASVVRSLGAVRLETLLLDEPTDGFSSEQMIRLGELFEELGLPQVIVVSHETQLLAIADRSLSVVKRDGRSTVVTGPGDTRAPAGTPVPEAPLPPTSRAGEPAR